MIGEEEIEVPEKRRKWNNFIEVKGARQNNLKNVDVKIPLNVMTVVTGVSGSGKSSLINNVFYHGLQQKINGISTEKIEYNDISGDLKLINRVELVDQNPIGRSSRSNPVTYIKAYDEIRKLYASQPLAKQMNFAWFSRSTLRVDVKSVRAMGNCC